MKIKDMPKGELMLLVLTRVFLGAGMSMLLAGRLSETARKAVGWTLVAVGVVTTVPLAVDILTDRRLDPGDTPA